jgi:hypothetical protein
VKVKESDLGIAACVTIHRAADRCQNRSGLKTGRHKTTRAKA